MMEGGKTIELEALLEQIPLLVKAYGFPDQSVQLHVHGMSLQQAWVDNQEAIAPGQ